VRECYFCQSKYSEERGIIQQQSDGLSLKEWLEGDKDLSDEEKAKRAKALTKRVKADSIGVLKPNISIEEVNALKTKLREQMDNATTR
jgi:hypothetical protein